VDGQVGQLLCSGLGYAEVDDLRRGLAVADRDQHVRRLQIAVNDTFLVRVLNAFTDLREQVEAILIGQFVSVAIFSDWHSRDTLHDEIRASIISAARIKDLGHVWMVHHGQGLALGIKAGDDLLCIHAHLDELQGYLALDGRLLLGEVDFSHSALTQAFEQAVGANLAIYDWIRGSGPSGGIIAAGLTAGIVGVLSAGFDLVRILVRHNKLTTSYLGSLCSDRNPA